MFTFFFNSYIIITPIIDKFDIIYIYENLIVFLYPGYSLIYKLFINLSFSIKYIYNIWLNYLLRNSLGLFIVRIIRLTAYYIWYADKWLNRRFFHRLRRRRIYYRLPNIRALKFLLFIYIFYIFFSMWKKRNLYLKSTFIIKPFSFYLLCVFLAAPIKYFIGVKFISTFLVINIVFFFFFINR